MMDDSDRNDAEENDTVEDGARRSAVDRNAGSAGPEEDERAEQGGDFGDFLQLMGQDGTAGEASADTVPTGETGHRSRAGRGKRQREASQADTLPPSPPLTRVAARNASRERHRRLAWRVTVVLIVVVALVAGGALLVGYVNERLAVRRQSQTSSQTEATDWPGPGYGSVEFTVEKGESSASIGEHLAKAGIVASASAFTGTVVARQAEGSLQPGVFSLKYHMSSAQVVAILTNPANARGLITVTQSSRVSQVVSQAATLMKKPVSDFQALLDRKGAGILPPEAGGSYEGWLQPDTYDPKKYDSAQALFKDMVRKRIAYLDGNNVPKGAERERLLTVASIICGEVNKPEYYARVSRVIQNRLERNMPLGMDSVVAYGNNVEPSAVTQAMLSSTSNPYNNRIRKGLPPTPINNPGIESIRAAQNPEPGDWLYFVTVNLDTGETKFTADEKQFEQYAKEYHEWSARNGR